MIFEYDELKEYVTEDFERFYEMGFNEKQIFSAVLNEYEHGEDFGQVENICIHIFVALNYVEKGMNYDDILKKLGILMDKGVENKIKESLENDYTKFIADIAIIKM